MGTASTHEKKKKLFYEVFKSNQNTFFFLIESKAYKDSIDSLREHTYAKLLIRLTQLYIERLALLYVIEFCTLM